MLEGIFDCTKVVLKQRNSTVDSVVFQAKEEVQIKCFEEPWPRPHTADSNLSALWVQPCRNLEIKKKPSLASIFRQKYLRSVSLLIDIWDIWELKPI